MGTTLFALFVGAIRYYIGPRIEAWIHGEPYTKPETRHRVTATVIVAVGTWVLLFAVGVVTTVYRDHVNYTAQNAELRIKVQEQHQEIKQLQEQVKQLAVEPEAPDSLRKRTWALADEWTAYVTKKLADPNKPPDASPNSSDPHPSEEQQKAIQKSQEFYRGVEQYYREHFKDRFIGIIEEYKNVGVDTHFLESTFAQFTPYPVPQGGLAYNDPLSQFRELAYHVDAKGHLFVP
jgi:hypothetical protein